MTAQNARSIEKRKIFLASIKFPLKIICCRNTGNNGFIPHDQKIPVPWTAPGR